MKTKKIAKSKTALGENKAIIYLHASKSTKIWLQRQAKKIEKVEGGKISLSTMAERIFNKAKKNPSPLLASKFEG